MDTAHPNLAVLERLDLGDLDSCEDIFADSFVWHYFNVRLPELAGDYPGIDGLKSFFAKLGDLVDSSFQQQRIDARPVGDELVVTQVCNQMVLDGKTIEIDAVVVWRVVGSEIAEAWDIPAVNTVRTIEE